MKDESQAALTALLEEVRTVLIPTMIALAYVLKPLNTEWSWPPSFEPISIHLALIALPFLILSWLLSRLRFRDAKKRAEARLWVALLGVTLGFGAVCAFLDSFGSSFFYGLSSANLVFVVAALVAWRILKKVGEVEGIEGAHEHPPGSS